MLLKHKRDDTIDNKISDINYIRGLTVRYEAWSPNFVKKTNLVKENISLDEIDLLKYEIKKIEKKLKPSLLKLF